MWQRHLAEKSTLYISALYIKQITNTMKYKPYTNASKNNLKLIDACTPFHFSRTLPLSFNFDHMLSKFQCRDTIFVRPNMNWTLNNEQFIKQKNVKFEVKRAYKSSLSAVTMQACYNLLYKVKAKEKIRKSHHNKPDILLDWKLTMV